MGKILVHKYGGSSVADPDKIRNAANRIVHAKKQGYHVLAVVSALGDTTDNLVRLAHEITGDPNDREMDMLMSSGEQMAAALISMAIHQLGFSAVSLTGQQVGIYTDNVHTKAKIKEIRPDRILKAFGENHIVIVAGFQGVNDAQDITTLGRGGSDTTAVALAAILKAEKCEIYTDVNGIYTVDPHVIPEARKLDCISYDEMLELASLGAKVVHARSIEFAKKYGVVIHVRSSFNDLDGTLIVEEASDMEDIVIRGATVDKKEAKITISGVPDKPGIAAKIFLLLADNHVNIDMIIQNVSADARTDISFTVPRDELNKTMGILEPHCREIGAYNIKSDDKMAKLSVVGIGMRTHSGVASILFQTLAKEGINIAMISTSEIKISCVIDELDADKALKAVYAQFNLG